MWGAAAFTLSAGCSVSSSFTDYGAGTFAPVPMEEVAVWPHPDSLPGGHVVLGTVDAYGNASRSSEAEVTRQALVEAQRRGGNGVVILNRRVESADQLRPGLEMRSGQTWVVRVTDTEAHRRQLLAPTPGRGAETNTVDLPEWVAWVGLTRHGVMVRPVTECPAWQGRSVGELQLFRETAYGLAMGFRMPDAPACQ